MIDETENTLIRPVQLRLHMLRAEYMRLSTEIDVLDRQREPLLLQLRKLQQERDSLENYLFTQGIRNE
jgi:hypothetical protein